ncbi:MAG: divalent-cation tolerance protein CutA [Janthinobacterium lividum]
MTKVSAIIYVTFPNHEIAMDICGSLLEDNLIACANIFSPHTSLYKWDGNINQELEIAAILKTRFDLYDQVQQKILSFHPYKCPCIVMTSLENGNPEFLKWIDEQTIDNKNILK